MRPDLQGRVSLTHSWGPRFSCPWWTTRVTRWTMVTWPGFHSPRRLVPGSPPPTPRCSQQPKKHCIQARLPFQKVCCSRHEHRQPLSDQLTTQRTFLQLFCTFRAQAHMGTRSKQHSARLVLARYAAQDILQLLLDMRLFLFHLFQDDIRLHALSQ